MKKILSVILILVFVLSLSGCGRLVSLPQNNRPNIEQGATENINSEQSQNSADSESEEQIPQGESSAPADTPSVSAPRITIFRIIGAPFIVLKNVISKILPDRNFPEETVQSDYNETSSLSDSQSEELWEESSSEPASSSELTSSSKPAASSKPKPSTSKPAYQSKPNEHEHEFSEATCYEPATCECGETRGKALGHKFEPATCQTEGICKNCGEIVEGLLDHSIDSDGVCKTCHQTIVNKRRYVACGSEGFIPGKYNSYGDVFIRAYVIDFQKNTVNFDGLYLREEYANEYDKQNRDYVVGNGKKNYYWEGMGGEAGEVPFEMKCAGDYIYITVEYYDGLTLQLERLENDTLRVASYSNLDQDELDIFIYGSEIFS